MDIQTRTKIKTKKLTTTKALFCTQKSIYKLKSTCMSTLIYSTIREDGHFDSRLKVLK